jgi:hypothetical protein
MPICKIIPPDDALPLRMRRRTMTETLRIQEEIASLRAIVHTLRMGESHRRARHSLGRSLLGPTTLLPSVHASAYNTCG